jgi:uncharacterized protein
MRSIPTLTVALALGAALATGQAAAQTVGFGSTPGGGWTNSAANAIAKVVVEHTDIKMRVQPQGSQPLNNVNADVLQFGLATMYDASFFRRGAGYYEGNGEKKDLRVVGVLAPLYGALYVRKGSDMHKVSDIKGKRVSSDFEAQKSVRQSMTGLLSNGGLTWDDVEKVPAPTVPRSADDFIAGKTDVLFFTVGSAAVKQAAASVGGLRALQIDDSPQAVARLEKVLPGAYVTLVKPAPNLDGISEPTKLVAFDMAFFTNKKEPDDLVYEVTKTLHDNKAALVAIFKPFGLFQPDHMAKVIKDVPFHPGALKYYKEIGIAPKQ